jgi:hypothetical protein
MIALAERLNLEGRESVFVGPQIMWRLLPNDAGRVIKGTGALLKISSPIQRPAMSAARGASTAR